MKSDYDGKGFFSFLSEVPEILVMNFQKNLHFIFFSQKRAGGGGQRPFGVSLLWGQRSLIRMTNMVMINGNDDRYDHNGFEQGQ